MLLFYCVGKMFSTNTHTGENMQEIWRRFKRLKVKMKIGGTCQKKFGWKINERCTVSTQYNA